MLIQVHCYNEYQNLRSHTLKDTTDYINFIEKKRWKNRTFLVSVREMLRLILVKKNFFAVEWKALSVQA